MFLEDKCFENLKRGSWSNNRTAGLEEEKSEADAPNKADKRRKRPSTVDEEIHAASKRSRKEPSAEPISKTDEKKRKCTDGKKRKREASVCFFSFCVEECSCLFVFFFCFLYDLLLLKACTLNSGRDRNYSPWMEVFLNRPNASSSNC